jgi:triosephosphate isomerase (TIM)
MRKKIVAGNWKMNKSLSDGVSLFNDLIDSVKDASCTVIVAPSFIHLAAFQELARKSSIKLAAQNCAPWESGAYTGEVSASMIASTGAEYVLIGHSERRQYFSETNEMLAGKIKLVLQNNLIPIFCCGESLEERESEKHFETVADQLKQTLFQFSPEDFSKIVIAYEPIWAIGTGKTASAEQAQQIHNHIRSIIREYYGEKIAQSITILYGGSCNPSNAKELFSQEDIDGGLIGGASLKADDFIAIINSF